MNVSLRCWSPFHANECVFSLNEQQKVYYIDGECRNKNCLKGKGRNGVQNINKKRKINKE